MAFKRRLSLFAGIRFWASCRLSALRLHAGKLEEISEQRVTLFGGDAFGMELHAMRWDGFVCQPHDDAVRCLGRDFESHAGNVLRSTISE